ncbi:MAG: sensor histidine kinase YclK [Actinomycetota bacterium]|jgi:two-component system OmpR family sensor kinase
MTLRLKVLLASSLAVILSLAILGSFALSTYRSITLENLTLRLDDTVREIEDIEDSPLQAAFYLSTVANFSLLVGIADLDGRVTSLSEVPLTTKQIAPATLESATLSALEVPDAELLIRTIRLPESGYVILATDLGEINRTLSDLQRNILLAAFLLVLSNAILMHLLMRGDFARVQRLAKQANSISEGNYKDEITPVPGNSEIAQLSQSIASMTKTLQENSENMQVLFGSISHELKTPLTAIRGYVELLENSSQLTADQLKSLDVIADEVQRMTVLINDLLLLSKLGTLTYQRNDTFELIELIQHRVQVIRDLQPERAIQVVGNPLSVTASRGLIERLLDNLVANALTHTSPDVGITFSVSSQKDTWTLEYQDTGQGLPPAYGDGTGITFHKFDARKTHSTSSGLGLFIIQSIVSQHQGQMEVFSGPGLKIRCIFPNLK